jgi:hypothetical protein
MQENICILGELLYKNHLISKYKLPQKFQDLSSRQFIQALAGGDNKTNNILLDIRRLCIAHILQNNFEKHCAKQPATTTNDQLKNFFAVNIKNYIGKDVRGSGRENIVKLTIATIASGCFIAPPLAGVFLGIGLGILVVGELVTRVVAYIEVAKFNKAAGAVIETALREQLMAEKTKETIDTLSLIKLVKPSAASASVNLSKRLSELALATPQKPIENVPPSIQPVDYGFSSRITSNRFQRLLDQTTPTQPQASQELQLPLLRMSQ